MDKVDQETLRRLLPALLELLDNVATGEVNAWDVERDYVELHTGVRALLAKDNLECICPWPNVYGWLGTVHKWMEEGKEWQAELNARAKKPRIACELDQPPPWTLIDYFRDGDPDDTPFWSEFVSSLAPHKQVILREAHKELAIDGVSVCENDETGHIWLCSGKRGQTTRVLMHKIKRGHDLGEVALRVFFVPTGGKRELVVLHGFDKGADADPAREVREKDQACVRRSDFLTRRRNAAKG